MFVRFKKKQLASGTLRMSAVLVSNHRQGIWSGVAYKSEYLGEKIRQRVIKHLASIRENELDDTERRREFWEQAKQALNDLLNNPEYAHIRGYNRRQLLEQWEASLAAVVPRVEQPKRKALGGAHDLRKGVKPDKK